MKIFFLLLSLCFACTLSAQNQTGTGFVLKPEQMTEKNQSPTFWGVAQGAPTEAASYLVCPMRKRDGNGVLFTVTYLIGYDENDNLLFELMVTDYTITHNAGGTPQQATVIYNGWQIDLSVNKN